MRAYTLQATLRAAKAPPLHTGRGRAAPCTPAEAMAIYRLSADIVRRSAGRTVTAAAAYRAGACLIDERTGLVFDYRRRAGVAHREVLAPAGTPAWVRDRTLLWNAVEAVERRKDAQLARDIELALPHELTQAQRLELVRGFVLSAFVAEGMVADIAIHEPTSQAADPRNHHAHVLLTMRPLEGGGFGPKARAWNDKAKLAQWRASWAEHVNRALEQAGEAARVDHRSLAARGIDREPQPTLGRAVMQMEARGIPTERGDLAREVEAINAALAALEEPAFAPATTARRAGLVGAFRAAAGQMLEWFCSLVMPAREVRAGRRREEFSLR